MAPVESICGGDIAEDKASSSRRRHGLRDGACCHGSGAGSGLCLGEGHEGRHSDECSGDHLDECVEGVGELDGAVYG